MISSRPSLSISAIDNWWLPCLRHFAGLDLVPLDRSDDGIQTDSFQRRPISAQVLQVGRGRITELTTEDQQRFPIDDQLRDCTLLFQMRSVGCDGGERRSNEEKWVQDYNFGEGAF